MQPLILINTLGLTSRLLPQAERLHALPSARWQRPCRVVTFWGKVAGLPATAWMGRCAAEVVRVERADLTLVYLPHLDYDTQRLGPEGCDWARLLRELDEACAPLLDAARAVGARVWVVNEYTHLQVRRAVQPNRALR